MKLCIKLFGPFEVLHDGQPVTNWPRQKTKELFKVLVSERGRAFTREQLIELLFTEGDPAKATNNLQKRVSELRRVLEPRLTEGRQSQFILPMDGREQGYLLSKTAPCWVDTEEFQKYVEIGRSAEQGERWTHAIETYRRAAELYRGDFLAEDLYADWTLVPREGWKERFLSLLACLAECHAQLGQFAQSIECCERASSRGLWSETLERQRMLYFYHTGEREKALAVYEGCVTELKQRLNAEPARETVQAYEQIRQRTVPARSRAVPNNLPYPVTSFIGRKREIEAVNQLLISGNALSAERSLRRLITLTGVGGCGKTRLALEAAKQVMADYADGAWCVELAALSDAQLVPQVVAGVFGLPEQAGCPWLSVLSDYLHTKHLILILDNCEHLVEACAKLAQILLQVCPKLTLLATSREALGVPGETIWAVPPLSVPTPHSSQEPSTLEQYESVRLFVERARTIDPEFQLTQQEAPAIARLCHQLDGIPLALELAAARVRSLSVEQIATRLKDRFRLLQGGNRAAPLRHQTLRATMDWSYHLLSPPEQVLLRRLSVFAGGWTLSAAEAVCADDGARSSVRAKANQKLRAHTILDLLTHLVEKSLVSCKKHESASRYELLETVRQYAAEKLKGAKETRALRQRHLNFFLSLTERAEPELVGPDQKQWLDSLEEEHDNLRAAFGASLASRLAEKSLRLATALGQFWEVRGYWTEGRETLAQALKIGSKAPIALRAKALRWMGVFTYRHKVRAFQAKELLEQSLALSRSVQNYEQMATVYRDLGNIASGHSDYEQANHLYKRSLTAAKIAGSPHGIAFALRSLGITTHEQGDYPTAQDFHEQSLEIVMRLGNKREIAGQFINLAAIADDQGDFATARDYIEESLKIMQGLGDRKGIGMAFNNLGENALRQGDYKRALVYFERCRIYRDEIGDMYGVASVCLNLGIVAHQQGNLAKACDFFEKSLAVFQVIGDKLKTAECLEEMAKLSYAKEKPERASRLFGAASRLRELIGCPIPTARQADYNRSVCAARAALGEKAFAKAWKEGRAMSLEEAIEYALAQMDRLTKDRTP
jgi:predicted ATPase/DNA-binding SARP family transcriptional activator/Tfp pilus assembly protein PilF